MDFCIAIVYCISANCLTSNCGKILKNEVRATQRQKISIFCRESVIRDRDLQHINSCNVTEYVVTCKLLDNAFSNETHPVASTNRRIATGCDFGGDEGDQAAENYCVTLV